MVDTIRYEGIGARARTAALKAFGEKLRGLRESAGLIQERLATQLDVATQTVRNWEAGRVEPNLEHKEQLAALYEVSLTELDPEDIDIADPEISLFFKGYDWDEFTEDEHEIIRYGIRTALAIRKARERSEGKTEN